MTWQHLPPHLESRIVSEISTATKLKAPRNKYRNNRPFKYGIKWASDKELARYEELRVLSQSGYISDIELQPKFEICPSVQWNDRKQPIRYYIADFRYFDKKLGLSIVEDVKSSKTAKLPVYTLKRQLLLARYPDITFREVY
jgi:hypothetical protein